MGLEAWYYSPPLPPAHEIKVSPEEMEYAETLALSDEGKSALTHGVEIYILDSGGKFLRGMFAVGGFGGLVARLPGSGTMLSPGSSMVIPAEMVDAGLLGWHRVPDFDKPIQCGVCKGEIPGRSPTGRCKDDAACKARRVVLDDIKMRDEFQKFADGIDTHSGWIRDEQRRLIRWAAGKIEANQ